MRNVFMVCCVLSLLGKAVAVVPGYLPSKSGTIEKTALIVDYFKNGFTYSEIIAFLMLRHGIIMSLRQLKWILKKLNLRRRGVNVYAPLDKVIDVIHREIQTSGSSIGYRTMWRRLCVHHQMTVRRDDVMTIMKVLDPEGVKLRKEHRLKRRLYCAKGPNYIWHVDGYDKLKPFGFCIHGAIDGFSRKIIWLEVSDTNNDPKLIARYYLDALKTEKKCPQILRCDAGTENTTVCLLQQFFRNDAQDAFAGSRSVIVGRSTSNQRIERWWGSLRQQGIQWWINFFKDLRDSGRFDELDAVQCENLKFCFMHLIQVNLDRCAQMWNTHNIRPQHDTEMPYGRPDVMYFLPEVFDVNDRGTAVDLRDVKCCKEMYSTSKRACDEFRELAQLLKPDMQLPLDPDSALKLFLELKELIANADSS